MLRAKSVEHCTQPLRVFVTSTYGFQSLQVLIDFLLCIWSEVINRRDNNIVSKVWSIFVPRCGILEAKGESDATTFCIGNLRSFDFCSKLHCFYLANYKHREDFLNHNRRMEGGSI